MILFFKSVFEELKLKDIHYELGGGGLFFEGGKGVIIIIICHSGLNKIAMGGHFFKKKTKCKKICLPHNYVSLLLVFF